MHALFHGYEPMAGDIATRERGSMSLGDCIEYISDDELLEVTPLNLRMRKRILNTDMRRKAAAGRDISQMVDN